MSSQPDTGLTNAKALIAAGVPIFLAKPAMEGGVWNPQGGHNRCGYWLPRDWQHTEADPAILDPYVEGMAVCAVMGHGLDLLDFDSRSGGDQTMGGLIEAGMWPNVYGMASTPSGGIHAFVAAMGVRSRDGVRPGFDVKAGDPDGEGRGFGFIDPTRRMSKVDGVIRPYIWHEFDLDRLAEDGPTDDSGEAIAEMVQQAHSGTKASKTASTTSSNKGFFDIVGGPWERVPELLKQGRNNGVFKLASALRGRASGWQLQDAINYMRAVIFPQIDQQQAGHPFTMDEFEATIRHAFDAYPSGKSKSSGPVTPAADRTMVARRATDMPVPKPVTWLAVGWLPLFAVIVLVGDEGIGKSLFWVYVVAYVTTGRPLPEIGLPAREPRDVIIVITEDSWAEVRARLVLAGADLDRIHLICEEDDGSGSPIFPTDMQVITDRADEIDPAMIVLDSWLDTVASGMSIKDPQQARTALHPWKEVAQRHACAVVLLSHTNRQQDASTRDRMGGTGALRQKARMVLFAAAEAEGVGAQLFIGPDKANSTARANVIRFDITVDQVRPVTVDDPGTVPVLGRPVEQEKRIGALIEQWRAEQKEAQKPPNADQRAEAWLREYMKAHNGTADVTATQAAARVAGHSARRITEVLKAMGGVSAPGGQGGPWEYRLTVPVLPGPADSLASSNTDNTGNTDGVDPS